MDVVSKTMEEEEEEEIYMTRCQAENNSDAIARP
jgi:hypothetical protein